MSKVAARTTKTTKTKPAPEPRGWTPRFTDSGTFPGESAGAAIRRNVAWLALAREQLNMGGDTIQTLRDLESSITALTTLSLEVDSLEAEALDMARKVAS